MTISIILPAYNAELTLPDTLASVAAQTWQDWELLVVDDGSSDATAATAEAWANSRPHASVRVIRLPANRGPAAARNEAVRASGGTWLAFLDADDVWLPWRLSRQVEWVRCRPDAGMVCGRVLAFDDTVPLAGPAEPPMGRPLNLSDFAVANPVATSTVLLRRDRFDAAGGFDERFRGPEDFDLWLRVAACSDVWRLDEPLGRYRQRQGSLSLDDRTFLPQIVRVINKAYGPGGVFAQSAERSAQVGRALPARGEGGIGGMDETSTGHVPPSTSNAPQSTGGSPDALLALRSLGGGGRSAPCALRCARRKAMAWQHLSACWMAAQRGAPGRAFSLWLKALAWWPFSFRPERELPWGRLKLLIFMARGATDARHRAPGA